MSHEKKQLLRDAFTFHGKLLVDGLKDFTIFWASIAAAVVDLVFHTRLFYRVMRMGRRFDGALDLHGR